MHLIACAECGSPSLHFSYYLRPRLAPPILTYLLASYRPHFPQASYLSGRSRTVDVSNAAPEEVLRQAALLRSSAGRKSTLQVKQRVVSHQPSVQGRWTPAVQDSLL